MAMSELPCGLPVVLDFSNSIACAIIRCQKNDTQPAKAQL